MDWADELASRVSGPQVVNDSKTPSGTVHVGSLRGPVIVDTIARALRANGIETTYLYGVDDMDPMDAQALLTPDAIDREMGRPLAHVPDPAGDCHASYARHFAGLFIDTFEKLGIRPDRYYWMSDIYPTGQMDPFIRTALDRAEVVRDIYARVANVHHAEGWLPLSIVCPTCGKVGTTLATDWDGETSPSLPARLRDVGEGLRHDRADLAVRRYREAAVEPRVGRAVVAVRRDHRAVRQGPLDRRRVARPVRRDRPRGLRARAAAQRRVRVPQHRRHARCRPRRAGERRPTRSPRSSRRSSCASCSCGRARTRPSNSIPRGPTRSPGCSTSPTGSRRRRPGARSGASCRPGSRPRSATRCRSCCRRCRRGGRLPAGLLAPGAAAAGAGRGRAARVEAEKGSELTPREREILARAQGGGPSLARHVRAGARDRGRPAAAAGGRQRARRRAAPVARTALVASRAGSGDQWQAAIFTTAEQAELPPGVRSMRSTARSSAVPTGRVPAGCSRRSTRTSSRRASARPRWKARLRERRPARLREEPDVIRKGAVDKGEDPALVDRALGLDAERRRLSAETEASRRGATTPRSRSARRSRAAPKPDGPEVAELKRRRPRPATGSSSSTQRSPRSRRDLEQLLLRIPNPADPDVPIGGEEANVTVRTWGEQLAAEQPRDGEVGADAPKAARPGRASRTGRSARRSTSSTTRVAPRSRARASRSTRVPGRPSSGRSSTGSSTSTPARTG